MRLRLARTLHSSIIPDLPRPRSLDTRSGRVLLDPPGKRDLEPICAAATLQVQGRRGAKAAVGAKASMNRGSGWKVVGVAVSLSCATLCNAADSLQDLLACREVADESARLACFDREAAVLAPASKPSAKSAAPAPAAATPAPAQPRAAAVGQPVAPSPAATATPAAAATANSQEQFGLSERVVAEQEIAAGTRPAKVSKIEAHLVRTGHTSDGYLIFTLDNDQVWRQLVVEEILTRPGEDVTISRASLGSFWLKMSSGRGCKVTRLR
jgi:hypothetical protein